jgi:hypothetical protein
VQDYPHQFGVKAERYELYYASIDEKTEDPHKGILSIPIGVKHLIPIQVPTRSSINQNRSVAQE